LLAARRVRATRDTNQVNSEATCGGAAILDLIAALSWRKQREARCGKAAAAPHLLAAGTKMALRAVAASFQVQDWDLKL